MPKLPDVQHGGTKRFACCKTGANLVSTEEDSSLPARQLTS